MTDRLTISIDGLKPIDWLAMSDAMFDWACRHYRYPVTQAEQQRWADDGGREPHDAMLRGQGANARPGPR